jgi:hypothetical protein
VCPHFFFIFCWFRHSNIFAECWLECLDVSIDVSAIPYVQHLFVHCYLGDKSWLIGTLTRIHLVELSQVECGIWQRSVSCMLPCCFDSVFSIFTFQLTGHCTITCSVEQFQVQWDSWHNSLFCINHTLCILVVRWFPHMFAHECGAQDTAR